MILFYLFSILTIKMQRYTFYLFLRNALHVSDCSSAHHQELKTVYTASGTLSYLYWYRFSKTVAVAGNSKGLTKYPMLYTEFWAPDDGRSNRLKHVEHFTEINKLCKLHLVGCTWQYVCDARPHERQILFYVMPNFLRMWLLVRMVLHTPNVRV